MFVGMQTYLVVMMQVLNNFIPVILLCTPHFFLTTSLIGSLEYRPFQLGGGVDTASITQTLEPLSGSARAVFLVSTLLGGDGRGKGRRGR